MCKCDIKPLAVLVILGDAFHNFTDGLALGAAISQDLALGVSTITALVFHEVPHELGEEKGKGGGREERRDGCEV